MEELIEYMWLRPKITKLKVDIFVDDGLSYIRHNHNLILLARNGYDKYANGFIPILVSENPIILDKSIEYNITYEDIFSIQDFIVDNLHSLQALANKEISHTTFIRTIKTHSEVLNQGEISPTEMQIFEINATNLPFRLWVGNGVITQGHHPALKFRADYKQKSISEYASISLTNPPRMENIPQSSPLNEKDIKKIEDFVISNINSLRL